MGDISGAAPADWDSTFRSILGDLLRDGHDMRSGSVLSIGGGKAAKELLNYSLELRQPCDRLLFEPRNRINMIKAAGRFAWMMAANDRVADISWYDRAADLFSDDGFTVPGSADGARLLRPRQGLNQLEEVIRLLREEPDTRRAAAMIYQPEDAGRRSRDIPCTMGFVFNIRGGALHATTVMRSSNAFKILPYDLFLFSMVAEVVAAAVEVEFGTYHQFAASLHIYEVDIATATDVLASPPPGIRRAMPAMPRGPVLEHIRRLVRLEQDLRRPDFPVDRGVRERIAAELPPYWQDFARLLWLHAVRRRMAGTALKQDIEATIVCELGEPFRQLLPVESHHVPV